MQQRKPSDEEEAKFIEDGNAVKDFRKTRVARLLDEWIEKQRAGQHQYMEVEVGSLNGLGIVKFFNSFLKYIYLVQENRAYRKLEAFFNEVEANGEKYAEIRRKRAERASKSSE